MEKVILGKVQKEGEEKEVAKKDEREADARRRGGWVEGERGGGGASDVGASKVPRDLGKHTHVASAPWLAA